MDGLYVVTLVESPADALRARRMLASRLAFGGELGQAPVWIYATQPVMGGLPGEDTALVEVPPAIARYPFAAKVCAYAAAEERARQAGAGTLVWLNPECLVVKPPRLFELAGKVDAAFRPVHHRNIGSLSGRPLNPFWVRVYASAGLSDAPGVVESFADRQILRPYYNTHCFALNPALGLGAAWLQNFTALVNDRIFQSTACRQPLRRIFLHQAVLSALLTRRVSPARLRLLPSDYSYPLHFHAKLTAQGRSLRLDETTVAVYEDEAQLYRAEVEGPLKTWLDAELR